MLQRQGIGCWRADVSGFAAATVRQGLWVPLACGVSYWSQWGLFAAPGAGGGLCPSHWAGRGVSGVKGLVPVAGAGLWITARVLGVICRGREEGISPGSGVPVYPLANLKLDQVASRRSLGQVRVPRISAGMFEGQRSWAGTQGSANVCVCL